MWTQPRSSKFEKRLGIINLVNISYEMKSPREVYISWNKKLCEVALLFIVWIVSNERSLLKVVENSLLAFADADKNIFLATISFIINLFFLFFIHMCKNAVRFQQQILPIPTSTSYSLVIYQNIPTVEPWTLLLI